MCTWRENAALRRWELALLLGVALAALLGVWLDGQQAALADKVIRLHVVANSDTAEDQALKLAVRDRILEEAEGLFAPGTSLEEARAALEAALPALAAAGADTVGEAGYAYPVSAALEDGVWFPTKEYEDFSLPAGQYTALRLTIGEGAGQNWWCVVFPPLCLGSVSETAAETAAEGGFSREEIALIAGEDEGYVVKFKAIELWEQLQSWMEAQAGGT